MFSALRSPSAASAPATVDLGSGHVWPLDLRRGSPRSYKLFLSGEHVVLESPSGSWGAGEAEFLAEKMKWLRKQAELHRRFHGELSQLKAERYSRARLFGRPVPIVFAVGPKLYYRFDGQQLTVVLTQRWARRGPEGHRRVVVPALRRLAADYLIRRTRQLAQLVGVTVNDIRVKGHRSKWGSCTHDGHLNLNWYLILLPRPVSDYVILHELMHRREMNHGPNFWAHVAQWMPDYKEQIRRLRADEWVLGAYEGS